MKVLGIDYGSARIGLAISDDLGITARPLTVVKRKDPERDLDVLENEIRENRVELLVLGLPLRLDGSRGIQCEKVEKFAQALRSRFGLQVVLQDETLSTWEAEEILISAGIKGKDRRKIVDKIAAGIILQSYLNSLQKKKPGPASPGNFPGQR